MKHWKTSKLIWLGSLVIYFRTITTQPIAGKKKRRFCQVADCLVNIIAANKGNE